METGGHNKRGQVLVLLVLALVVLLAVAGLALDAGTAYMVKTKLGAAVDAAALAAGKVAARGASVAGDEAARFFSVNYPDGMLGASVQRPVTALDYDEEESSWTVTVSTTATVPAHFARAVGWNNFTVGASATSTVAPVDLVLVLDCSNTLNKPSDQTFEDLKGAARGFIDGFNADNDRVGLILFASGTHRVATISENRGFDKDGIKAALPDNRRGGAALNARGFTTAGEALRLAMEQLNSIPKAARSRQRIIVFFADGAPNGVAAKFTRADGSEAAAVVSSQSGNLRHLYQMHMLNSDHGGSVRSLRDLPVKDWTGTVDLASFNGIRQFEPEADTELKQRCNVNRAARNIAENVANAARTRQSESEAPITVFTIGLGSLLTELELSACGYGPNENGENIMKRIANIPGVDTYNSAQPAGIYAYAADSSQLDAAFDKVTKAVLRLSK